VLVAEDNPVNQDLATSMLESLGCRVTVAATGVAAVAALERTAFAIVLMDVQMPEMDGLVATAVIREREARAQGPRVPIIALTANVFAQDREACFTAGMDDYLGKPFTLEQLHAVVARWLSPAAALETATARPADESSSAGSPSIPDEPAASAPAAMLDQRALDQIRALQRPGAPSVVGRVIQLYLTSTPPLLTAMRAAIAQRNNEAIRQAAHSLKSSSANVGATMLADLCRALESEARTGACPEDDGELHAIETAFHDVQLELEAELSRSA
jgi:CheY-like chemotaxis protein